MDADELMQDNELDMLLAQLPPSEWDNGKEREEKLNQPGGYKRVETGGEKTVEPRGVKTVEPCRVHILLNQGSTSY